jgi:NAD(P)-dependent dehydrogenase (short-subunit alcohol dehydrogenase family)
MDYGLQRKVAEAVSAFGRIDCAANCAGVGGGHASTHEYPVETWDRILAINLRGTWLSMRVEIPAMLADGKGGAIVNVASTLGLRGRRSARPTARASTASSASPKPRRSSTRSRASASTRSAPVPSTRR